MAYEYENFDLRIGAVPAGAGETDAPYWVEVTQAPGERGTEEPVRRSDPLNIEMRDLLDNRMRELIASPDEIKEFGERLFEWLFPEEVRRVFRPSKEEATRLRIRLQVDPDELRSLPWECLYDEELGYLSLKPELSIVRKIPLRPPARELAVPEPPVRVLAAFASPTDMDDLDVDGAEKGIRQALQPLHKVDLKVLNPATKDDLHKDIVTYDPHILHFSGHGQLEGNEGALVLEKPNGTSEPLYASRLRYLASRKTLKVVVLNACETAASVPTSDALKIKEKTRDAFMAVAPALVGEAVPAVIAMQFLISDEVALLFTEKLYSFLAEELPLDAAMTEARNSIYGKPDGEKYFGIPVLFLRAAKPSVPPFAFAKITPEEALVSRVVVSTDRELLVAELQEWKLIHNESQVLLGALQIPFGYLTHCRFDPDRSKLDDAGFKWQSLCVPKLKGVPDKWGLQHAYTPALDDLRDHTLGLEEITRQLMQVEPEGAEFTDLYLRFEGVFGILWDLLTAADKRITVLIETLRPMRGG